MNFFALIAFFRYGLPLFPFLIGFLCNVAVIFATRHAVAQILGSLETPAHDLDILALLVERLERESFQRRACASFMKICRPKASRRRDASNSCAVWWSYWILPIMLLSVLSTP